MSTLAAVTDPFELFAPVARTQSPTARSDAAADCVSGYVVDPFTVTLTVVALGRFWAVAFFVGFFPDGRLKLADENPEIVRLVPVTAVTLPVAKLPAPANPPPGGRLPDAPFGGPPSPPGKRRPPLPPALPPPPLPLAPPRPVWPVPLLLPAPRPPKPAPLVQVPDDGAGTMATDLAVIVVDLAVVPVTVTQSPTATDDAAVVAFCVNVVDDVHVTVA